jgi:outer membrane lipoprotein-sorting protein
MKKLFFWVLLLVLSVQVQAQDKKAKNLLNQVSSKVKSYKTIKIDFKYSLQNAKENVNQESSGSVVLQNNKYQLQLMGVTKLFDGKRVYTINPEDEEITISKGNDKEDNLITPSKMLTFYNKGYSYSWDISQNVKGRSIQYIKLVPTTAKDQRKQILLGIDVKAKQIYNLIEVGKNGTKTTLTVVSFKTNQKLSANQFKFDKAKYPNYYINTIE